MPKNCQSYWLDQRDLPDPRFGRGILPGCSCTYGFTCRVYLEDLVARNISDRETFPTQH